MQFRIFFGLKIARTKKLIQPSLKLTFAVPQRPSALYTCVLDNSEIITNESNELSCEKQHHSVCPSEKKFKQVIKMKDKKRKRLLKGSFTTGEEH